MLHLLIEDHKKSMEVVTDCFKTLFSGLLMNGIVFGSIEGVHQQQQQQHELKQPREDEEHTDGEEGAVEDSNTTQEGPDSFSGGVGVVTSLIVPTDLVGEYLILWSLLPDICPY